ncbi:hypothetical protein DERP_006891 [Dermatophagoides pteronyssinus]|uniref:Uncharacterized protein n=1 Tax=Dermatophagoides pteronyssinus TaxID=6956 RepID=A0ABQ8IT21_DERPT|nr:hypothetical protein DERP_006891 [Dermatophagoides pteronyssinus]
MNPSPCLFFSCTHKCIDNCVNASINFGTINPGILPILFVKPINVPAKSGAISTCVELKPLKQAPLNVTANINNVELAI